MEEKYLDGSKRMRSRVEQRRTILSLWLGDFLSGRNPGYLLLTVTTVSVSSVIMHHTVLLDRSDTIPHMEGNPRGTREGELEKLQ